MQIPFNVSIFFNMQLMKAHMTFDLSLWFGPSGGDATVKCMLSRSGKKLQVQL